VGRLGLTRLAFARHYKREMVRAWNGGGGGENPIREGGYLRWDATSLNRLFLSLDGVGCLLFAHLFCFGGSTGLGA